MVSTDNSFQLETSSSPASTFTAKDATRSKTTRKRRVPAEKEEKSDIEVALTDLITQTNKSRQQMTTEKDSDDLLFESFAIRLKKLPKEIQSHVRFQTAQTFFNAENRHVPPVPICPLPPIQNALTTHSHHMFATNNSPFTAYQSPGSSRGKSLYETSDIIASVMQYSDLNV